MHSIVRLAALVLLPLSMQAETLHVTAVRNIQPTDPAPVSRAFRVSVIEGNIGTKHYTAQQLHSWGTQDLIVGEDYVVDKQDSRSLTVVTHDKKGREVKERLDITGVTEK